jgi:hypothetical protein
MMWDVHPGSGSRIQGSKRHRIPDSGVKKAPDPDMHIAQCTRMQAVNTVYNTCIKETVLKD